MFFLHNRLSSDVKALDTRLSADIKALDTRLSADIKALDTRLSKAIADIADLKLGLTRIEDRIEFSGKVVYIKPEKNSAEES